MHSAFLAMILARLAALAVGVVAFAVTGRLIEPLQFGNFALVLAGWLMLLTAAEFGLRSFLIRERALAPEDSGRAMGLCLALAALGAAAMVSVAVLLPAEILDPEAATAAFILAPALIPAAAGAVAEAVLQRAFDFRLISRIAVLRALVDAATAIVLAMAGYGAAALAAAVLASHLVATAVLIAFGGHAGALRPRRTGWARFRAFGVRVTGTALLPNATGFGLLFLLGAVQGQAVVGLYNRSMMLHQMLDRTVLQGVQPVVLPAVTKALGAGEPASRVHGRKTDYLAAVCWPAFALIALLAHQIVGVLLGPDWDAAVPAVQILAAAGLFVPINVMSSKTFVATGHEAVYFGITATQQGVALVLGALGAVHSLEAFCLAVVVAAAVKAVHILHHVHRLFGDASPPLAAVAARAMLLSLAALAGPAALLLGNARSHAPAGFAGDLALLAVAGVLALFGWAVALRLLQHGLWDEFRATLALRRPKGVRP